MANRRATSAAGRRSGKAAATYSQLTHKLLSQRDELVTAIAMLRSRTGTSSPFIGKAETLLTRHWARADWQARAEILQTVRWLLSMAQRESTNPPRNDRKTKRAARTQAQA